MAEDVIPEGFESQLQIRTKTGDDLDMVISTGYVRFAMRGRQDGNWNRQDLVFDVGPRWVASRGTVAVVSPSSMMNVNVANNAGWAVDRVDVTYHQVSPGPLGYRASLRCGLAVRDSDGYMFRVNYHVTTIGQLAESAQANDLTLTPTSEQVQ